MYAPHSGGSFSLLVKGGKNSSVVSASYGCTANVNNGIDAAALLRGIQSIKVNELARHTYL